MAQMPVEREKMPRHVAIIMDGNGRWAKQRGLPRLMGHRAGVEALRPVIEASGEWGIEALTLFAFSTENWSRPREEVGALMGLIDEYFQKEIDELDRKGTCIRILGEVDGLPRAQQRVARRAMERTRNNRGLKLNIALNYGGRADIVQAARTLARQAQQGVLLPEAIDEAVFEDALYTGGLPQVDLLVRTSGEMRISNYLLYQIAYAELVFVPEFWPDFTRPVYARAIKEYAARSRRFGAV